MYVFVLVDVCGCKYVGDCEIWIFVAVKIYVVGINKKNRENFDLYRIYYD